MIIQINFSLLYCSQPLTFFYIEFMYLFKKIVKKTYNISTVLYFKDIMRSIHSRTPCKQWSDRDFL